MLSTMALASPTADASATASDPIFIADEADLIAQAGTNSWPGSGTEADPYVIANLTFSGASDPAVYINNVQLYVVVRDCTFTNCAIAVELDLSSNVTVTGNTIEDGYEALVIYGTGGNTIANNTVNDQSYGFYLSETEGNIVCDNTLSNMDDYAVLLEGSHDNIICRNNVDVCDWCAICLAYSNNNTISGNIMTNSWIGVYLEYLGSGNVITGNSMTDCYEQYGGIKIADTPDSNAVSNNTIAYKADEPGSDNTLLIAGAAILIVVLLVVVIVVMKRKKA
jgi:parallel beta-helix repeat protein